ncbi:MAG: hypothetical protein [Caudoviricetes sp.]|nr:MAG: hypothetical protein [Caudoviricetes sp.]
MITNVLSMLFLSVEAKIPFTFISFPPGYYKDIHGLHFVTPHWLMSIIIHYTKQVSTPFFTSYKEVIALLKAFDLYYLPCRL